MNRRLALGAIGTMVVGLPMLPIALAGPASALRLSSESLVLVPAPAVQVCDVIEELAVVNPGGQAADVYVTLPSGAKHIALNRATSSRARVENVVHQQQTTLVLVKGAQAHSTTQVTISFTLPFTSSTGLAFTFASPYAADSARLYLPISGFSPSAPNLQAATQTVTISGTRFRVFTRLAVPSQDEWPITVASLPALTKGFHVRGLPQLGRNPSGLTNDAEALGNVAILVFVLLIGLYGIRQPAGRVGPSAGGSAKALDALYDAWVHLEQQHADGAIDAAVYADRREKLRNRIVHLQRHPSDAAAGGERNA